MVKILIDRGNAPQNTGIGNYSSSLLAALKLNTNRFIEFNEAQVSSIGHKYRPLRRIKYLFNIYKLIIYNRKMFKAIHFTNIYVPPKVNSIKYIVTIHDIDPVQLPNAHSLLYYWYFRYIVKRSIERADLIFTDTESVRSELIEMYDLPSKIIKNLGVGLSYEFIEKADKIVKKTPAIPTLLFVGQLNKKKNVNWLIRAIDSGIKEKRLPDMKLILAGSPGYGYDEIKSTMKEINSEKIVWIKSPNLSAIVELYKTSSALIVPSLREGFGIPLLEAMYCDLPIVASKIQTNLEVANNAAFYFSLENTDELYASILAALINDGSDKRKEIAQIQLNKYDWNVIAHKWLTYYQEIVVAHEK